MEIHPELFEPTTPALSQKNVSLWAEDSGYHTSFTPGSVEISNENLIPSHLPVNVRISGQIQVNLTPESNSRISRRLGPLETSVKAECFSESPVLRCGVKRPLEVDINEGYHGLTPTSKIAGGIQRLRVNDSSSTSQSSLSFLSLDSGHSNSVNNDLYHLNNNHASALSYPSTPVKKICRTSCNLSPMRRSLKRPNFAMHSLSCEARGVMKKKRKHSKVVRTIQFRPEQKIDLIKMLYRDARAYPPLIKILSYLSNEDICTFRQTSPMWSHVWDDLGKSKRDEYKNFLRNTKENLENKNKGQTPHSSDVSQFRSLKEVHNMLNTCTTRNTPRSPPGTPRTNKFRKFTKSASLDSRLQLSCVRCSQPAKVTEETSGEEWAECTSTSCSYQFCRFCSCNRHPGKTCLTYDLGRPSPSKRKNIVAVATKKSKRNLRRLLL